MQSNNSACRRAVQCLLPRQPHLLWITDDVLADAFHRFANVSNATRTTRKRYGSNVPGPLEARRRLAKRRMMGLSAAGGSAWPDIGALFGPDGPTGHGWKWEPPKAAEQPLRIPPSQTHRLPQWLSEYQQSPAEDEALTHIDPLVQYQRRLATVRDVDGLSSLWVEMGVGQQRAVLFSRMACTHFIEAGRTTGYADLFKFLRNPRLNISEAENTRIVIAHAAEVPLSPNDLELLITTIQESLLLGTILESELDDIVDTIGNVCRKVFKDTSEADHWLFEAYWAMWHGISGCKITSADKLDTTIVRKIAERVLILPNPIENTNSEVLGDLKRTSYTDPALFRLEIYRRAWGTATRMKRNKFAPHLASWAFQLSQPVVEDTTASTTFGWNVLISLLDSMGTSRAQEAMAITTNLLLDERFVVCNAEMRRNTLELWFTCLSQTRYLISPTPETRVDLFAEDPTLAARLDPETAVPYLRSIGSVEASRVWMRYWLLQPVARDNTYLSYSSKQINQISTKVEAMFQWRAKRAHSQPVEQRRTAPFFWVIDALATNKVGYTVALRHATYLILRMYGPDAVYEFYVRLQKASIEIRDPVPFAVAVEAISESDSTRGLDMFMNIPELWLSLCPNLALSLIRDGRLSRILLFKLLARPRDLRKVSRRDRSRAAEGFRQLNNNFIHIVAYAYADQNRPWRQRFRNVYSIYLYLRDRQVPLQPLLTKAFVRAAVTSRLENKEWVSTDMLAWILKLVRQVEGREVAEKLDKLIWEWRGELIEEARRRWEVMGLRSRSSVAEARRRGLFDRDFPKHKERMSREKAAYITVLKAQRKRTWGRWLTQPRAHVWESVWKRE